MVAFILPFWHLLGISFLCKIDFVRVAWLLCWKEMEKRVGSNSFLLRLDNLERAK